MTIRNRIRIRLWSKEIWQLDVRYHEAKGEVNHYSPENRCRRKMSGYWFRTSSYLFPNVTCCPSYFSDMSFVQIRPPIHYLSHMQKVTFDDLCHQFRTLVINIYTARSPSMQLNQTLNFSLYNLSKPCNYLSPWDKGTWNSLC